METPEREDLWEIRQLLEEIRETMQEPEVSHLAQDMLEDMWNLLNAKGQDYSGHAEHTFKNFEIAAELTNQKPDLIFVQLMATKFARLVSLLSRRSGGRPPNFESLEDTWMDLANYIVLYVAYKHYRKKHP